jgi:hypothetical protein
MVVVENPILCDCRVTEADHVNTRCRFRRIPARYSELMPAGDSARLRPPQIVLDRAARHAQRASRTAALRRSIRLRDKGRLAEAFTLLAVAAKAGIADVEHQVALLS